jgi:hypothetical protein
LLTVLPNILSLNWSFSDLNKVKASLLVENEVNPPIKAISCTILWAPHSYKVYKQIFAVSAPIFKPIKEIDLSGNIKPKESARPISFPVTFDFFNGYSSKNGFILDQTFSASLKVGLKKLLSF